MTVAVGSDEQAALAGVAFGYPLPDGRRREVLRSVDLSLDRGDPSRWSARTAAARRRCSAC
jgi:hypothetical protein